MARNTPAYFQNFSGPETFLVTSLEREGELGNTFDRGIELWQLVQCALPCTAKDLLYWSDKDAFVVSTAAVLNAPAGVAEVTVTVANSFIWIKQRGVKNTKAGAGVFALGTRAVSDAANNQVIPMAATDQVEVGIAQGASVGGFVDLDLTIEPA